MTKTIVVALVTVAALTSPVFAQEIEARTPETLVIAGQHTTIPLLTLTQAMDLTNFRTPTGS
jgi:EamA domain-containing membrane protein RarD